MAMPFPYQAVTRQKEGDMVGRINASEHITALVLLALLGFLFATVPLAFGRTGTFRVVILRTFYTDYPTSRYTDAQMAQAANEIHDYFATLSHGNLDVQVSVAKATLSHSRAYYWSSCSIAPECETPELHPDVVQAADADGFSFDGIHGIALLNPWELGDWAAPNLITINLPSVTHPGVSGTFTFSYNHETVLGNYSRLVLPPGPSGVYWNSWVHEIGHQLQVIDRIPLGGLWNGHPSLGASGYDLMSSCYPCGENAYDLSGPPAMNGRMSAFPGWLPASKVLAVTPSTTTLTFVLAPMSVDPSTWEGFQALKVLRHGTSSPGVYYMVQARIRAGADAQPGHGAGIYDEGVEILDVDEQRDPPVTPLFPCNFLTGPDFPCISNARTDTRASNCRYDPHDGRGLADPIHAGLTPSYCWPHPLWHAGDTFVNIQDPQEDIWIKVDRRTEDGFAVMVGTGAIPTSPPDVYIRPASVWTRDSIDIWTDSSINGYEEMVGPPGLRYGRREDGTVIGNGDDPSLNHENRIYASIHNQGETTAEHVRVNFYVLDPREGGILLGQPQWILAGVATEDQFPALQALAHDATATVYVTWKPAAKVFEGDAWWMNPAFNYSFPTSVRVVIDPVKGERVTSNNEATEGYGALNAVTAPSGEVYLAYPPQFVFTNPWPPEEVPRPFYLGAASDLPPSWTWDLGKTPTMILLGSGDSVQVPVNISIPLKNASSKPLTLDPQAAESGKNLLTVYAFTPLVWENEAVLPDSLYRTHRGTKVVGEVLLDVLVVLEAKVELDAKAEEAGVIAVSGVVLPSTLDGIVALDYTDPLGNTTTRLVTIEKGGLFEDRFSTKTPGSWIVQAIRAGDLSYSGTVSEILTVDLKAETVFTLTVLKSGTGNGTVSSSPPGINCGGDCNETYSKVQNVKLTAEADSDSAFTGWSGGGCSGTGTCEVTVDGETTVTASFALKTPDISVAQTAVDFGIARVGKTVKRKLAITNNGAANLAITLEGLSETDFSSSSSSATVKPKKTYSLKLTFKPSSGGEKTATLRINSDDPDTPTIDVMLSGTGQ